VINGVTTVAEVSANLLISCLGWEVLAVELDIYLLGENKIV
jgi:hypothetical protein